ncbi:hypothetical protein B0H34DRAFT_97380 [Crassisporium funariophilum]|nr:hypothetical protein B0H34DRAFT_97380 [Crassisporium funariophilum]
MNSTIPVMTYSIISHKRRTQVWPTAVTAWCMPLTVLVLVLSSSRVAASPVQAYEHDEFEKRDGSDSSPSMSPKIWIPIVVAIVVLFCIAAMHWAKISMRKVIGMFGFGGAVVPGGTAAATTRELTAEQLAGTINGDNAPASGAQRTRRQRRPRRTPSQISTTSLPAYNKEPGDEELVIFRGRDMEDATMPAAVVMTSVDEDREGSMHSRDNSQVSRYSPMPTSPNNMPLLHADDTSGDLSLQSLQPPGEDMPRRSFDSSSHESSSLMRVDSNLPEERPDPRGEAPAYFEVTEVSPVHNREASLSSPEPSPLSQSTSPDAHPGRRSGFRTLLNRMATVAHPHGHSAHNRSGSDNSVLSSEPSGSRHRASPSGSGSLLTNSLFRPLSRQRSTHTLSSMRLNSPSMISLNSISSPLSHTLVRTEFTYPKSGPTPEQLKVISSRETFARFGVPYGADAIAFAASSSRQNLDPPPPDFDAAASSEALSPSSPPDPSRNAEQPRQEQQDTTLSGPVLNTGTADGSEGTSHSSPIAPASISRNGGTISSISKSVKSLSESSPTVTSSTRSHTLAPIQTVNEFGKLSAPPPSSFQDHTQGSSRSESRVSNYSFQSYATAAESLTPSTALRSATEGSFYSSDGSEPSTPRLGGQHVLERTDATVTPATVAMATSASRS